MDGVFYVTQSCIYFIWSHSHTLMVVISYVIYLPYDYSHSCRTASDSSRYLPYDYSHSCRTTASDSSRRKIHMLLSSESVNKSHEPGFFNWRLIEPFHNSWIELKVDLPGLEPNRNCTSFIGTKLNFHITILNLYKIQLHSQTCMIMTNFMKWVRVMVFNATFNNILVISRWPLLLMRKTTNLPQVRQTLSHNIVSSTPLLNGIRTHVSGDRHWLHR